MSHGRHPHHPATCAVDLQGEGRPWKVADRVAEQCEMKLEWGGGLLRFRQSGVFGKPILGEHEASLEISLDFLLKAFEGYRGKGRRQDVGGIVNEKCRSRPAFFLQRGVFLSLSGQ